MSLTKEIKKLLDYFIYNPQKYWNTNGGEIYYNKFPPLGDRYENIIFEKIIKIKPKSIIDIGCGYGRYLKYISTNFPEIELTGVDISYTQVDQATKYCKKYPNIKLLVIDGKSLPFKNNTFDMAFTFGCLSALPYNKIADFYTEIKRVTLKTGLFLECNKPENYNKLTSKKYWFYHNYHKLFDKESLIEAPLHPINGDTLYQVKFNNDI